MASEDLSRIHNNFVKIFNNFFDLAFKDGRLNTSHISVYMALLETWNLNKCKDPILIKRDKIMAIAKIKSIATYHKCIKELNNWNYINYRPQHNPAHNSYVYFSDGISPT